MRSPVDQSSSVEHHPVDNLDELDSFLSINILQDARIQSYIEEMASTCVAALSLDSPESGIDMSKAARFNNLCNRSVDNLDICRHNLYL